MSKQYSFERNKQFRLAFFALALTSLFLSAAIILRDSGVVPPHPMDQSFAQTVDLHIKLNNGRLGFSYPNLQYSGGITASLLVGLYKLIVPYSQETLNWHVRIFSMLLYLLSGFGLLLRFVKHDLARLLALLVLVTSGFQFIQPSSELIAGTALSLFVLAASLSWPRWVASFFLSMFALCKVEFGVAALAMALVWIWKERRTSEDASATFGCLTFFGWMAFFLIPAFVLAGANPLSSDRSFLTISNTYIEFFQDHQFANTLPAKLLAGPSLFESKFPLAKSAKEFILFYPKRYLDYLGISSARSLFNTIVALKLVLLSFGFALLNWKYLGKLKPYIVFVVLATLLTLLPAWLVVHIRERYYAKLFPLIVALATAGCIEIAKKKAQAMTILTWTSIVTIFVQLFSFQRTVELSHFL